MATPFERWFKNVWSKPGEGLTTAVARLHVESGASQGSIRKALKGQGLRADVALGLEQFSNGKLTKESLVFPEGSRPRAA